MPRCWTAWRAVIWMVTVTLPPPVLRAEPTLCAQYTSCSECTMATFGCDIPPLSGPDWPWWACTLAWLGSYMSPTLPSPQITPLFVVDFPAQGNYQRVCRVGKIQPRTRVLLQLWVVPKHPQPGQQLAARYLCAGKPQQSRGVVRRLRRPELRDRGRRWPLHMSCTRHRQFYLGAGGPTPHRGTARPPSA